MRKRPKHCSHAWELVQGNRSWSLWAYERYAFRKAIRRWSRVIRSEHLTIEHEQQFRLFSQAARKQFNPDLMGSLIVQAIKQKEV